MNDRFTIKTDHKIYQVAKIFSSNRGESDRRESFSSRINVEIPALIEINLKEIYLCILFLGDGKCQIFSSELLLNRDS